jgi:hypothetical protein
MPVDQMKILESAIGKHCARGDKRNRQARPRIRTSPFQLKDAVGPLRYSDRDKRQAGENEDRKLIGARDEKCP